MIALHAALFTAAFVLAGSQLEPQVLTLQWPDGHKEEIAATSPDTCRTAVDAIVLGLWRPGEGEPVSARCGPGNLSPPGSACIAGFNCGRRR